MDSLTRIDGSMLAEHRSLYVDDNCYFLLEYTAQGSYPYSLGNVFIKNLKKKPDRKESLEWSYKEWTIQQLAAELINALPKLIDFSTTTLIPIPPSKTHNHPQYDDRVMQVLRLSCPADADIRESIVCRQDHASVHETDGHDRPSILDLMSNYRWADTSHAAADQKPFLIRPNVVLFDDVITSGNHFTACKRFLHQHHPATRITGIFIARRALNPSPGTRR